MIWSLPLFLLLCMSACEAVIEGENNQKRASCSALEPCDWEEEDKPAVTSSSRVRSNKKLWNELRTRLERIRESCGELCDTNRTATGDGKYYPFIKKEVDCRSGGAAWC